MESLTQLGIGGTFALIIIKIVFDHLKTRKNGNGNVNLTHLDLVVKEIKYDLKEFKKKFDEIKKDLRSEIREVDGKRDIDVQLLKNMIAKKEMDIKDLQYELAVAYISKVQCKSDQEEFRNDIKELRKQTDDNRRSIEKIRGDTRDTRST